MGFLSPLFLAGLAAIAVPVLLHLFRRETAPEVPFAPVRYLRPTRIERQERRRIQDWWLLLLRALALAVLAFAFARPYVVEALPEQTPVVIAIDTSYSMSPPETLAAARAAATEVLDDLPAGTPVALVTFDDRASVAAELTSDHGGVRALIASVTPGYGGTRYAAAIEAARAAIGERAGRAVVVTDMQARGWSRGTATLPDDVDVEVVPVGVRVDNVLVRELTVQPDGARAVVSNAGAQPVRVEARLERDGQAIGRATRELPAGISADVTFAGPLEPGPYSVVVDDPTGFAADDVRHVLSGAAAPTGIRLLVGVETDRSLGYFLERAYAALGADDARRYAVETSVGDAALRAEALREAEVNVWLAATGIDRRQVSALEDYVRAGGRLIVACGPSLDARVADVVTRPLGIGLAPTSEARPETPGGVLANDPRHPMLAALGEARVALGRVHVARGCQMEAAAPASVVATFSSGRPAIAEARLGEGRLLVLATDLARQWNDLPVQPAFLPLVGEMTAHLLGPRGRGVRTVGDVTVAEYQRPGIWPIGAGGTPVAVNVDVAESDQARQAPEEFVASIVRQPRDGTRVEAVQAARAEQGQGLWRYGLMLLGATLIVEGVIARRPRRQAMEVSS